MPVIAFIKLKNHNVFIPINVAVTSNSHRTITSFYLLLIFFPILFLAQSVNLFQLLLVLIRSSRKLVGLITDSLYLMLSKFITSSTFHSSKLIMNRLHSRVVKIFVFPLHSRSAPMTSIMLIVSLIIAVDTDKTFTSFLGKATQLITILGNPLQILLPT